MAKNDKGTWVGKTTQPVFQTYPTAGMIQPAASSSTPAAAPPPAPTPPPQSSFPTDFTPTLPIGNITIAPGGGYPMVGDIILPNSTQDFSNVSVPQAVAPEPELAVNAPRLKLINAVNSAVAGPSIGVANASTLRGGQGSFYNIRRNN